MYFYTIAVDTRIRIINEVKGMGYREGAGTDDW
jgi:hypothetical protein